MKTTFSRFALSISNVNKKYLQIALMILVLAMLVLGAGAPEVIGGSGV